MAACLHRSRNGPTMFSPDLLRGLVAVVDCGGFTRAAERLGTSQGAMSVKLRRLEAQTGRQLLRRSTRGVPVPTPDGELLLGYAREVLQLLDEAQNRFAGPALRGA